MRSKYDCLIHHQLLKKDFIYGPVVDLKLISFFPKEKDALPYYMFQITCGKQSIGTITLRLGYNEETMVHGHIGYEIQLDYQGHHYSYYALEMIKDIAREHGYRMLLITSESNNNKSIRTISRSGGTLIAFEQDVPKDHIFYVIGKQKLNVYEIVL
ncbi:GNAT family N-acetyltransferase [Peloplasma aerotolerans]|jgi:predicted acetyltransferase|uniref:GNAT family N-acetyltransferase n=1 Tax=Peloplasma aerotolerans TaxID=3044389 RepID=A0AAW6U8U9_9MOLU|nr:GNAT family N-acetyltransferase [Mariniplasma sp. M4Ah]MDI6453089.1 GNAT family N-acetyltransferase [Mariniplasma sp. M4Ah]MDR4968654.1 GNAT family N-acetyltransferase [Acholeplasmataceae bacterium]